MTQPQPRHFKHGIADAEKSSPVPWHSRHTIVAPTGKGTRPFPPQAVQVSLLTAPVPRQCAQRACGPCTCTMPRPLQTQQVENQDMMPKESVPVPWQKAQETSAQSDSFEPCLGVCRSEKSSHLESTTPCLAVKVSVTAPISVLLSGDSPWEARWRGPEPDALGPPAQRTCRRALARNGYCCQANCSRPLNFGPYRLLL